MAFNASVAVLLFIILTHLPGCAAQPVESTSCPPFPKGGPAVAEELETIPYDGYEDTWEWIGRLDKLKDQLDAAREIVE